MTSILPSLLPYAGYAALLLRVVVGLVAIEMVANAVMKVTKMKGGYVVRSKPSYEIDVLYLLLSIVLVVLGAGVASVGPAAGL